MRIGLIADIHGNLFALTRVLKELDGLAVQEIFCLGDIATPGPWPSEVLDVLDALDIQAVMGNTDHWLLAADDRVVSDVPEMNAISRWASSGIGDQRREGLAELPKVIEIEPGNDLHLLMFHGSPLSTTDVMSERTPERDILEALNEFGANVGIGGHTHVQMIREFDAVLMINPGSVGLGGTGPGTPDLPPVQPASTADFAVIDVSGGEVATELYRLPLDVAVMIEAAGITGMPHLDWWASLWNRSR